MLSMIVIAITAGCAGVPDRPSWDPFTLIWPLPPEKPRIKYVGSLAGEADVQGEKRGWSETLFGATGELYQLVKPYSVTTDDRGRVYVSDANGIAVFDMNNKKFGVIGRGVGKVIRPLGMFFDKKNNLLYVTDSASDKVIVFTPEGRAVMALGQKGELVDPGGVTVDSDRGRVYVSNTKRHVISVFDTQGNYIRDIGERGSDKGQLNFPAHITIDRQGNIYIVDLGNFRVQVFDPDGNYMRDIGGIGMAFGQFARPKGIALDPDQNLHITDAMFHGVTVFDNEGTLLLTWGARGTLRGLFQLPAGIHIDENGLIYVVSQWNARVDIFQYVRYPED